MSWKVNLNGYIEDESGGLVCMIPPGTKPEIVDLIVNAPRMFEGIVDFIDETDNGGLSAKKHYNKFVVIRDAIIR